MNIDVIKSMELSDTTAMMLGGISPNIIHELSGVYPNFVKAFKEVITNSYDADATRVKILISPDYDTITVYDNGRGMSFAEFKNDYLRLGSSIKSRQNDKTEKGRLRIGSKGIGFLALARYCRSIELISHTNKVLEYSFQQKVTVFKGRKEIRFIQSPLADLLAQFVTVKKVKLGSYTLKPEEYEIDGSNIIIFETNDEQYVLNKDGNEEIILNVGYQIDCSSHVLEASIDYERILSLSDNENLENLSDFAYVTIRSKHETEEPHYTKIILCLNKFIQDELKSPKKTGRVRNIASLSGIDKFIWHLSRSLPIKYSLKTSDIITKIGAEVLNTQESLPQFDVSLEYAGKSLGTLARPFLGDILGSAGENTICKAYPIYVETKGVHVFGYLISFLQPIFPAELRGISIRVRGVEIGTPGLWGAEKSLPVKYKSLLDHIVGELVVTDGIDAIGTIMAGREGFYEESSQFHNLRKIIIGDGNMNFGPLGTLLEDLYERISSQSSVERIIQENKQRREAFLSVSKSLSEMAVLSKYGRMIRQLFSRHDIRANGLSKAPLYDLKTPLKIGKLALEIQPMEGENDFEIDINKNVVRVNSEVGVFENSLYILGRDFEIKLQEGQPDDPLCELDFETNKIFVNWMHPSRGKMGDSNFIKSALSWRIAYLASSGDIDTMMNIAHRLLL